jgi:hypothetical protein
MDALTRAQDHYAMVVHPSQLLTPDEAALLSKLADVAQPSHGVASGATH